MQGQAFLKPGRPSRDTNDVLPTPKGPSMRAHRHLVLASLLAAAGCAADGGSAFPPLGDDGGSDDLAAPGRPDLAGRDLAAQKGADLAMPHGAQDMAVSQGMGGKPAGGNVGAKGGQVDRLYFAFHGDVRPMNCDDTPNYPTQIITSIFQQEGQQGVEFALDLGDHMFACSSNSKYADDQMNLYMTASHSLPKTTFLTMGNHECRASMICSNNGDVNYAAFLSALAPISKTPYYSFDVQTSAGLATFVIVADNAWSNAEQTWLENTLSTADKKAKYTFIARHHPIDNTDLPNMMTEWQIIQKHKYSIFFTGHTHEYKHDVALDPSRRTVRLGAGGAPLAVPPNGDGYFYGYGTVLQGLDGHLYVTIYDESNGNIIDAWNVPPQ